MEKENCLSDEDLHAEVDMFMFGGHHTTTNGITWIFYALATHPEHQQRCMEEVQSLLGDGALITWDCLDQMPYTTMCTRETLRRYPPVPFAARELSKPVTFPDGCSLPKGIIVLLFFYGFHHNPKMWPNPEVCLIPSGLKQILTGIVILSGESRNCIRQHFARNELKVAVALTLLRFELLPDPTRVPILIPQLVLKSQSGIHLRLRKLC